MIHLGTESLLGKTCKGCAEVFQSIHEFEEAGAQRDVARGTPEVGGVDVKPLHWDFINRCHSAIVDAMPGRRFTVDQQE